MDNGGVLDRVHFISQVRHPEDAQFLTTIIESNPNRYTYRDFGMMGEFGDYRGLWDHDIEPDTIYVKIGHLFPFSPPHTSVVTDAVDDDIVFIADNAIADLVEYKINHPEHLYISANIVNHPRLQRIHNSYDVPVPFAPEQSPTHQSHDWRISLLPSSPVEEVLLPEDWPSPPEYKHRWLPMRAGTLEDTPMRSGLNCSGEPQWQCATIAHYSLLYHLENRTLPPS
jgi:hypothetical protein